MSRNPDYTKVGLFIIAAIVIAVVGVIVLGAGALFSKRILVETYFEQSVQGLDTGAPLKFRGVRIGKTEEVALVGKEYATEKSYVLVRASIARDAFKRKAGAVGKAYLRGEIDKGLRIRVGYQGLTGTAHLEMDYSDPALNPPLEIDWKPRYTYIPSTPSTITRIGVAIDRIMRNLEKINVEELLQHLERSVKSLSEIVSETNLGAIAEQAQRLLTEVRETNRTLNQILGGPKIKGVLADAAATLAATRRLTEGSEKPLEQILVAVGAASESIRDITAKLDSQAEGLPAAVADLRKILRRLDGLIATEQQDVEEIIENLRLFSENMSEFSDNIKRSPSQLLLGKPPPPSKPGMKP